MRADAHDDPARVCRPLGLVGWSLLTSPLSVRLVIWTPAVIVESKTAFGPSAPMLKRVPRRPTVDLHAGREHAVEDAVADIDSLEVLAGVEVDLLQVALVRDAVADGEIAQVQPDDDLLAELALTCPVTVSVVSSTPTTIVQPVDI